MAELLLALGKLIVVGTFAASILWYFYSEARSIWAGAPFAPMPDAMIAPILSMVPLKSNDVFIDLGCGDGRVLAAGLKAGAGKAVGYEIAGWPRVLAGRRLRPFGARAVVLKADARTAQVSSASVVYMYLGARLIDELAMLLARELKNGAQILSPLYPINVIRHPKLELIETRRVGTINVYRYRKT